MPLTPTTSEFHDRRVQGYRVFLDDIGMLRDNLAQHGPVVLEAHHDRGATSLFSEPEELVGRNDIWSIDVRIEVPDATRPIGVYRPIEINIDRGMFGIRVFIDQKRPELTHVFDHFAGQLAPMPRRSVLARLRRHGRPAVDLVFDTRRATWVRDRQRKHEIKLELISGLLGAAIGAAATIAAFVLS